MKPNTARSTLYVAFCCLLFIGLTLRASEPALPAPGAERMPTSDSASAREDAVYSEVIPKVLILNSKEDSIQDMSPLLQKNVRRTLEMSPGLKLHFLNDADCLDYLSTHFDEELHRFAAEETYGPYRGDICRAAVLAREGGFYVDIDVEPRVPLHRWVSNRTTFMTVVAVDGTLLNALVATTAQNPIQLAQLDFIRAWYRSPGPRRRFLPPFKDDLLMGPMTLFQAVQSAADAHCPKDMAVEGRFSPRPVDELDCGPHIFRFFQERELQCGWWSDTVDCAGKRRKSGFRGVKFGLFPAAGPAIGWPRFEECTDWGCG